MTAERGPAYRGTFPRIDGPAVEDSAGIIEKVPQRPTPDHIERKTVLARDSVRYFEPSVMTTMVAPHGLGRRVDAKIAAAIQVESRKTRGFRGPPLNPIEDTERTAAKTHTSKLVGAPRGPLPVNAASKARKAGRCVRIKP